MPVGGTVSALLAADVPSVCEEWLPRFASGDATAACAFGTAGDLLSELPALRIADGGLDGTARGVAAGLAANVALVWAAGEDAPVLALANLESVSRRAVDSFDNGRLFADLFFAGLPK